MKDEIKIYSYIALQINSIITRLPHLQTADRLHYISDKDTDIVAARSGDNTHDQSHVDQRLPVTSRCCQRRRTAALPAWMVKRYPEVSRTDYEGRHHKFGQRHNAFHRIESF